MKDIRAAIIPHAGSEYSGAARQNAFKFFNDVNYIIYISAIHKSTNLNEKTYLLYKDGEFDKFDVNLTKLPYTEHSFDWVKPELHQYFPKAQILAITPLSNDENIINWVVNFLEKNNDCILLGTTDLIHYGKRFKNEDFLKYPQQLFKQKKEEGFINALIKNPINTQTINTFTENHALMCGPYAINLFVEIIKRVHYNGKVVDYYDSNTSHVTDLLDKYVIHPEKIDNLVSYVSIIYGPNLKRNKLIDFDIMIAIGAVKSQIYQDVVRGDYILSLPSWSPMYTRTHGVFVGTSIDGRTNCSYGRYEDGSGSSAKKIVQAAGNCFNDALQRWELPYNLNILDKMNYKVELLDSKNTWKKYKGSETHKKFKMDGKHGIYLTLPSGSSATYLPVVARENLDWSINKYMTSLTEKAGGKGNEWINGTIKVYKSQSYIWDAEKQKII